MSLSNTVLVVLSMSFVAILQLWLISWPLTNDVSNTSKIAILLLIGLTVQLFGKLILRIITGKKLPVRRRIMMTDRSKSRNDGTLQQNKKQNIKLTGKAMVSVKHYPLIVKEAAGPLMVIPPDSWLVQVTNE